MKKFHLVECGHTLESGVVETGGAGVVVVVGKVSLDSFERRGKTGSLALDPVGHEEWVLDDNAALGAGQP